MMSQQLNQNQEHNQNLPAASQSLLQQTGSGAGVKPFLIRQSVLACRHRNILQNWPFHEKHLQLCLKHGLKEMEVLPPLGPHQTSLAERLKDCSNLMHWPNDNNNNKEVDSCKAEVPHLNDDHTQDIKNEYDLHKVTDRPSSHEEGNQQNCNNISSNLCQPAYTCTLSTSSTNNVDERSPVLAPSKAVKDKRRRRKGRCKKRSMVDILAVARHSTLEEIHSMNKFYYAETVIQGSQQTLPYGSEDYGVANADMAQKGPLLLKFKLNNGYNVNRNCRT